jgi:ribulose-phosphate 3-epimerase
MKHLVAPSILSADFGNLSKEIQLINQSEADWIHCDVMDGRFVPNITFGFPIIAAVKKIATKPLDVHLMIVEPEKYITDFAKAGANSLSVHIEVSPNLHRTIYAIKQAGMKAGVAINPHTPVVLLQDVIHDIDVVCLMSVNPGYGGQKFIEHSIMKIRQLKEMITNCNSPALIEVDGGVDLNNAATLLKKGADVLVAGNTVFSASDPAKVISELKNISFDNNKS